jgi:hypothetical protein
MSTGLYVRNGMYPREPLYRVVAPAAVVEQNMTATEHDVAAIAAWPQPQQWIGRIDEEILGFRRDSHHRFLLSGFATRAVRIERAGRAIGYAYISAEGHVGPLAVAPDDADAKSVMAAAVRCALSRPTQVSMIVPGRSDRILGAVSELGFRIDEPFVLLSRPTVRRLAPLSAEQPRLYVMPT